MARANGARSLPRQLRCLWCATRATTNDQTEPIRIVRGILAKRVEVLDLCGDGRTSAELAKVATFRKPVRLGAISASLFPDTLTDAKGTFHKPSAW